MQSNAGTDVSSANALAHEEPADHGLNPGPQHAPTSPRAKTHRKPRLPRREPVTRGYREHYSLIPDQQPISHAREPQRSWQSVLCMFCVLCAVALFFTALYFQPSMAAKGPRQCQLPRQVNSYGEDLRVSWNAASCQRVFQCEENEELLTQRTCTREDYNAPAPAPRGVRLLVSQRYRVVYVVNPTSVNKLIEFIMQHFLDAAAVNSHHLAVHEVQTYFFFTFVERALSRFVLQFTLTQPHSQNSSSGCAAVRERMHAALQDRVTPSQSYLVSGDAGTMNHMLRLDWIADAGNRDNVIALLEHVQGLLPDHLCLPEIDFLDINFNFIQNSRDESLLAEVAKQCLNDSLAEQIEIYYKQDDLCWFT
jgi:hypothetical protein